MKKRIFAKVTAFLLLMMLLFSINVFADGYSYGYYVDNVEYIGNGKIEATIVFAANANTYGSNVDVNGVGVLAVYDETETQLLDQSIIEYSEDAPFLKAQRFSVTQTVSLTDLTLERYIVKFILLESKDYITPAAYVSTGTNTWVLEGDVISEKPTDNPSGGGSGGGGSTDTPDEDSTDLVISPELFDGFAYDGYAYYPNIRYYNNADAETLNTASKIEAPFEMYINKGLTYKSGDGDTDSDVAYALNNMIGSSVVNKVTTNNKSYRFKDTNNNGKYDKLIVENSASFVVGKINANGYEIYRNNSTTVYNSSLMFDGTTTYQFMPLDLDTSDAMVSYDIKDKDGNSLSFSNIKVGDVLNVSMSVLKSGEYHYDIVVSTAKAVTGTIIRVSTKKIKGGATVNYYTINGAKYRINGTAYSSKLEPGVSGTFYLTNDNAIINCDIEKNYSYGIVIATGAKTGAFENGVMAKIMTIDGEVKNFNYAETVSVFNDYYGEIVVNSKVDYDPSTPGFQPDSLLTQNLYAGTVIIFETNSNDEIKKIYTGRSIEEKENDDVRITNLSYSSYDAASSKIEGKYITDETIIIGVPAAHYVANEDKYTITSKNALADGETYEGTIVYDTATKEVIFAFITNLIVKPSYTATPMIVTEIATVWFEEEIRREYTGLIDGEQVRYVLGNSEDLTVIGMTGEVVTGFSPNTKAEVAAFDIGLNDVIQVVTNANDEIIAYRHIMKYDNREGYIAMLTSAYVNEDVSEAVEAKLTKLSDGSLSTYNAAVTNKQMYGYAVSGRVNKVTGRSIEIFIDPNITTSVASLTAASNIKDAAYDQSTLVYLYGANYSRVRMTVFDSIKSFDVVNSSDDNYAINNIASDMSKADDVVYLYSFDGENIFNFIIDVNSNNR